MSEILLLCDYGSSGSGSVYINVAHIWERNIDGDMYMLTQLDPTRLLDDKCDKNKNKI